MIDLNARLLAAHEREDKEALVDLYREAASKVSETSAKAFFLTQAYIFALDCGAPIAPKLRQILVDMGRDEIRSQN